MKGENVKVTNLQDDSANTSENTLKTDNVTADVNSADKGGEEVEEKGNDDDNSVGKDCCPEGDKCGGKEDYEAGLSFEEQYAALKDSNLRLVAEFDNFRKRTIREKADLIKSGGATVLTNLLPVIDDFERALGTLQASEDSSSAVEGVKLIYDKFISYLLQQGVKSIDAVGKPFDTEFFEAIAIIPTQEDDMKGKVIDCVQTGYMLYDKVLRHAKVVVGE